MKIKAIEKKIRIQLDYERVVPKCVKIVLQLSFL